MQNPNDRVYMMHLSDGVSAKTALTALAMTAYRFAPPMGDGDETHPEFVENGDLDPAEAVSYVRDDGITMLFVKGRAPLLNVEVCGFTLHSLSVRFTMLFDGASAERLLVVAAETAKLIDDVDITVEVDLSELFAGLEDEIRDDRIRALSPLLHVDA